MNLSALSSSSANVPTAEKTGLDMLNEQLAALKRIAVPPSFDSFKRLSQLPSRASNPSVGAKDMFQTDVESRSASAGTMNECQLLGYLWLIKQILCSFHPKLSMKEGPIFTAKALGLFSIAEFDVMDVVFIQSLVLGSSPKCKK